MMTSGRGAFVRSPAGCWESAARQGVQAGEARAEWSVEDVQAQHVPAYFRAA